MLSSREWAVLQAQEQQGLQEGRLGCRAGSSWGYGHACCGHLRNIGHYCGGSCSSPRGGFGYLYRIASQLAMSRYSWCVHRFVDRAACCVALGLLLAVMFSTTGASCLPWSIENTATCCSCPSGGCCCCWCPCRNPADVGGRMMTFTYVAAISGICAWSLPGGASSMFQRMSVSTPCMLLMVWHLMLLCEQILRCCRLRWLMSQLCLPAACVPACG